MTYSGVARAKFPGGRSARRERTKLRKKMKGKWERIKENDEKFRKCSFLARGVARFQPRVGKRGASTHFSSFFYYFLTFFLNLSSFSSAIWSSGGRLAHPWRHWKALATPLFLAHPWVRVGLWHRQTVIRPWRPYSWLIAQTTTLKKKKKILKHLSVFKESGSHTRTCNVKTCKCVQCISKGSQHLMIGTGREKP